MEDRSRFAAVLIAPALRRRDAEEAVRLAGGRHVATLDWHDAGGLSAHLAAAPILSIEAEGVDDALLDAALPLIADAIEAGGLRAVVTFAESQLDTVAAALLIPGVELLCAPTLGQQAAALALAAQLAAGTGLHDRVREDERDRQRGIAEEVARIATLLTTLAERERERGGKVGVGDRHTSFGFEPLNAAIDAPAIRRAIRARRLRDSFFGDNLFEDPAWDMLLDLYAARLEVQQVSVSSLCIASAVAATTALRWIGRMTQAGMFVRDPDPNDRRRAFITLSARALAGMEGYAVAVRRAGLPFA